jgi:hypothetical protein
MGFEDLSAFFSGLDVTKAVFITATGNREVPCYFDNTYTDTNIGEAVMDTTAPRITCVMEDIRFLKKPSEFRGMIVIVRDVKYSVIKVDEEGTGMATIALAHEDND